MTFYKIKYKKDTYTLCIYIIYKYYINIIFKYRKINYILHCVFAYINTVVINIYKIKFIYNIKYSCIIIYVNKSHSLN